MHAETDAQGDGPGTKEDLPGLYDLRSERRRGDQISYGADLQKSDVHRCAPLRRPTRPWFRRRGDPPSGTSERPSSSSRPRPPMYHGRPAIRKEGRSAYIGTLMICP